MKFVPLTQQRINVNQRDRVRQLERDSGRADRPGTEEVAPWSHAGAITVTAAGEGPKWRVRTGGQVVNVSAHLDTAGTTNTVVTFYLNGVSIGTVTLTATGAATDTNVLGYPGDYRAKNGDLLGCRITTAGAGAKGLSAFLVMKG